MAVIKRFPVITVERDVGLQSRYRYGYIIPMKLLSRRRPVAPLFSGWNWTPKVVPFPTDDAKGQIYRVVVSEYSGVVST